jgi:hypothetical protein
MAMGLPAIIQALSIASVAENAQQDPKRFVNKVQEFTTRALVFHWGNSLLVIPKLLAPIQSIVPIKCSRESSRNNLQGASWMISGVFFDGILHQNGVFKFLFSHIGKLGGSKFGRWFLDFELFNYLQVVLVVSFYHSEDT